MSIKQDWAKAKKDFLDLLERELGQEDFNSKEVQELLIPRLIKSFIVSFSKDDHGVDGLEMAKLLVLSRLENDAIIKAEQIEERYAPNPIARFLKSLAEKHDDGATEEELN